MAVLSVGPSKAHKSDGDACCVPHYNGNNYTLLLSLFVLQLCLCRGTVFFSRKSTILSSRSNPCNTLTCSVNPITMATYHCLHLSLSAPPVHLELPSPPSSSKIILPTPRANTTEFNITKAKMAWWLTQSLQEPKVVSSSSVTTYDSIEKNTWWCENLTTDCSDV